MSNPFALPPGPDRRELLTKMGYNLSDVDFTDAELEDLQQQSAEREAIFAEKRRTAS